jgi:hypothetical protein
VVFVSAGNGSKRPIDQLLDLFVYAPIGFVLNLEEVVPQLVEKGHQQVTMARFMGKMGVDKVGELAKERLEAFANGGSASSKAAPAAAPSPVRVVPDPTPAADEAGVAAEVAIEDEVEEQPATSIDVAAEASPAADDLAIPGYDSLSASQVVPRLEGLSSDERDAVRRYEAAHRGRKTILSKLAQLG